MTSWKMVRSVIDPKIIPQKPGVYLFKERRGEIIYVGKSVNLRERVKQYLKPELRLGIKTQKMVAEIAKVEYHLVQSEMESLLLETSLIKKYKPKYNISWKDDKSHLYIKITVGDKIPLVTEARRELEIPKVKLYGPFPSASTVRYVLRTLRRVFPYCQHKRPQKSCLWVHLGLCPDPYHNNLLPYRQSIQNIILFLEGRKKTLLLRLEKAMRNAAREERFEEAAKIKKQIEALEYVTSPFIRPEEYLKHPSLHEDLLIERLNDIKNVLKLKIVPRRIEAYDISNILGKEATGSMIVFSNGEPDKSQYRKFKIRFKSTPDDVFMIKEVLLRRLKNDWPLPDLILVDGGRGQLNAALEILKKNSLSIPILGLAKRKEEIYLPYKKDTLKLSSTSLTLRLLRHIRDEAHRFAITYHKKLRHKAALTPNI